jgi:hypothetical protein
LFVCLYHNRNTKEIRGQRGKAAQTEGDPIYDRVNLTSLSMVITAESAPPRKFVPLEVLETAGSRNTPRKVGMLLGQRRIRTFLMLVVGFYQMMDISFKPFQKLFASMGHMRQTTKADPC